MSDITVERLANLGKLIERQNERIDATARISEFGVVITLRDSEREIKRIVPWLDIELGVSDPLTYRFNEILTKMVNAREREARLWE